MLTFRKNLANCWAVWGPAAEMKSYSVVRVSKKDGSVVEVQLGGVQVVGDMAWGAVAPRPAAARKAAAEQKAAAAAPAPWCRRCHSGAVYAHGLCRSCHHDEYDI